MFLDLVEPDRYAEETLAVGQIEYHDNAVSTLVIRVCDGAVAFLPSCVPNLKLDSRLVNLQSAEPEVNTDSANVIFLEAVVL